MSTEIDQKVVEMRFDNRHFESNVSTTLSSLEKLKQNLKLDGATKGLENIDTASKKVNMSGLSNAVETVGVKFNAMWTIADQTLRNITNSVEATAKRMISAFTIDPVKTGFQEYETQINAVQTILANTQSKGTTLDQVNEALDTLNLYADKTIYNFTEMTRNIGTFTAAGVDLDTSVSAIQGIANLAAVSGSTSQQASTAMYQLSQALSSGTVKLMDWNSVVNAGMGGQVFQDALKKTSEALGTGAEAAIKAEGSFRESLTTGWLTAEVLTETLKKMTTSGANEYVAEYTGLTEEAVEAALKDAEAQYGEADAISQASKALAEKSGKSAEEIESTLQMAKTAEEAATKVKTFSQLMDTLKEAAQSGWTQTWEILVGDFEEAKELFTSISDTVGEFINKISESRNSLLEASMTSNWDKLVKSINAAGVETDVFEDKIKSTAESHGIDVKKLIKEHGSLKEAIRSGAISTDILKESVKGLKTSIVDLESVNRELKFGDNGEDIKKVQQALKNLGYDLSKFGVDGSLGEETTAAIKAFQQAKGLKVTGIVDEETLKALKVANSESAKLIGNVDELIDGITELGGREKLINGFKNIFQALLKIIKPIAEAFREIFPATTVKQLNSFIDGFEQFTKKLIISDAAADNIKRTFKGLFAVVNIVKQAFVAVFKAIVPLFKGVDDLGGGILSVTATWGDWLVKLDESIKASGFFEKAVTKIHQGIEKVREFLQPAIEGLKEFANTVKTAFSDVAEVASERLSPLAVIGKLIKNVFGGLAKIIQKVAPYIYAAAAGIGNVMKDLMDRIAASIQGANFDALFDVANGGIIAAIGVFIAKFIKSGGDLLDGAGGFLDSIKDILGGVSDALGAFTESLKAETLKKIATAIAILAASLLVLSLIDSEKLSTSLLAITTLFGELMASMAIFGKINSPKGISKIAVALIALSSAILILSIALKIMSTMSWSEMGVGLVSMTVGLGVLIAAVNLLPESKVNKAAKAVKKLSTSLVILAIGIKILSTMSWDEMTRGLIAMVVGLGALVAAVNLLPRDTAKRAAGMIALATSMVILAGALKIMATMSWTEIAKSLITLCGSLLILAAAMAMMKKAIPGALAMMIVAPALVVLSGALKIMGSMSWESIARGLVVLAGSLLIIAVAVNAMKSAIGGAAALLIITASLSILVPVLALLGSMSWKQIVKGLTAIAGAFAIMGIAALVLKPLVGTIAALSGSLLLLGLACTAVGVGVLALGAGITMIAVAFEASGVAIVTVVAALIALIPYLIEQIGVGIIKFCDVIAGGAAAICQAVTVIILAVVDAIVASVPAIVEGVFVLVEELLKSLVAHGPTIVKHVFDFLIGIINAIAEKLPDLIQAGVNLLMAFFSGVVNALKSVDPSILINGLLAVGMLSAIVVAMAAIAAMVPAAMVGVLGMGVVIAELAVVLAAIGALAQIPGLTWLVNEGGKLMQAVGTAIGKFIGGLIGGIAKGVSSSLPQIGKDLSKFMENIQPFIDGAKSFNSSTLDGVKSLVGIIASLTAVNILDGLTSWFTGGSSLTKFGEDIQAFGPQIKAFADSVAGIDGEAVVASANAAKALAEMTSHIPNEGGVVAWFTGENSISKFGTELEVLGTSLAAYSNSIGDFNPEAVTASANAAKALADMASNIPNSGGVVAWFTGENSIAKFGTELESLGESLAKYSDSIGDFKPEAVTASINAAKALTDMASNIPNSGGMVAWFTGENSIAKFGTELESLGNSLAAYSNSIGDFKPEAVNASINAAKALTDMASSIPNEGGVVAWFTGENSISKFGGDLEALGIGLKKFSDEVAGIKPENVTAAAGAAKSLAEMASSIPNEGGVVAWFTGENSISKFGGDLESLGKGLKKFSDSINGMNAGNVTAAANAAKSLAEMASYIPNQGGIKSWFTGESSISKFSGELESLGGGLKKFSDAINGINPENVTAAANAAKSLAEMASHIPNSGGVAAWFTGESSISKFGGDLEALGKGLKKFSDEVTGLDVEKVSVATAAAKSLAEMSSYIPNSGGVSAWFAGEQSISKFGTDLEALGTGLKSFNDSVAGIDVDKVSTATAAAKSLAELTTYIPNEGGIKAWFSGESGLSKFAGNLKPLGEGMKSFSDSVKGIDEDNVTAAARAAQTLARISEISSNSGGSLVILGQQLVTFGEKLYKLFEDINNIPKTAYKSSLDVTEHIKKLVDGINTTRVSRVAEAIDKFISVIQKISSGGFGSTKGFERALDQIAGVNFESLLEAFKNAGAKMAKAAQDLITKFEEGVDSKKTKIKDSAKSLIEKFVDSIKNSTYKAENICKNLVKDCARTMSSLSGKFKSAAKDLVKGFANGISANTYLATAKAKAMAAAAANAARKELDEHSPSKVGYEIGDFFGIAFVNSIVDNIKKAYVAGENLAASARKGLSNAFITASDIIDGNIDLQPTVRPVLDLSAVQAGAGAISAIFGSGASIGVMANVGSINSLMNQRSQNGANGEVVSAINKLSKKMDNMGNTTYQIDGVTYDDGSNVSEAVGALVRAVKVQRRV